MSCLVLSCPVSHCWLFKYFNKSTVFGADGTVNQDIMFQTAANLSAFIEPKCWIFRTVTGVSHLSYYQVLSPHVSYWLLEEPALDGFYIVNLKAGTQSLTCFGWTVRETSSLLDLQRYSEVLMAAMLSAAGLCWRRGRATASLVESNSRKSTRPERQSSAFQVSMVYKFIICSLCQLYTAEVYFFISIFCFVFCFSWFHLGPDWRLPTDCGIITSVLISVYYLSHCHYLCCSTLLYV